MENLITQRKEFLVNQAQLDPEQAGRIAEAADRLVTLMKNGNARFTFVKQDGTLRRARGTLVNLNTLLKDLTLPARIIHS